MTTKSVNSVMMLRFGKKKISKNDFMMPKNPIKT